MTTVRSHPHQETRLDRIEALLEEQAKRFAEIQEEQAKRSIEIDKRFAETLGMIQILAGLHDGRDK